MKNVNAHFSSNAKSTTYDEGLRAYMIGVYNYMTIALVITGVTAFGVSSSDALFALFFATPLSWVVMFAPLVMAIFVLPKLQSYSLQKAQMTFWIFAAIFGISMASLFKMFTGASITKTFFITASVFGSMSLYGYTTKKDISGWRSFLLMGLIGMIIVSIVNLFMQSPAIEFATSAIFVLLFVGFTAYDTQRIKSMYSMVSHYDDDTISKTSVYGALSLYMDFINLFVALLHFFGARRD